MSTCMPNCDPVSWADGSWSSSPRQQIEPNKMDHLLVWQICPFNRPHRLDMLWLLRIGNSDQPKGMAVSGLNAFSKLLFTIGEAHASPAAGALIIPPIPFSSLSLIHLPHSGKVEGSCGGCNCDACRLPRCYFPYGHSYWSSW